MSLLELVQRQSGREVYIYPRPQPYKDVLADMQAAAEWLITHGEKGQGVIAILEHEPVFTLGKRGNPDHLLQPAAAHLAGIPLVNTDRGGDITYHGPGQLVAYPILQMGAKYIDINRWVFLLEEAMVMTLGHFGLAAQRVSGRPGLFCGGCRKIGQVGVRIHEGVNYHGLSLNICPDLRHFSMIMPCGLPDVTTTSLAAELGHECDLEAARRLLAQNVARQVDLFFAEN